MKLKKLFKIVTIAIIFINHISARELCRATLDCPTNYANDTVKVPYNVVMLSEIFEHCSPDSIKEGIIDTTTDTISLFIIIDHSSSMSLKDPKSTRYALANSIIDSIYNLSPASEIGLAVFSNKLMHNKSTDPFLETLDSSEAKGWNDAFVPLTKLNSQVSGVNAVEKLKWSIEIDSSTMDGGDNYLLVNADYQSSGRRAYSGGTDISIAFEAAKEAFSNASYDKDKQFILFISDGKHDLIDSERLSNSTNYISGVGIPTTYTAYFINEDQAIPSQIKEMTTNIQNNGYSANNFSSKVWTTESQQSQFLGTIFNNIIGDGLKSYTSTPKLLIINGDTTDTFDSTYAYFNAPFAPLSSYGDLLLNVSFTYVWDSPVNLEETKNFTIFITQDDDEDLEAVNCWEQGTIGIYSSGSEIKTALPSQTNLEVRFYPSEDSTAPPLGNTINLILKNAARTDTLLLTLNLNASKTYYHSSFIREYTTPIEDSKLQNENNDSIIVIFRNKDIPLDTLNYSIPVMPLLDMKMNKASYYDNDANGHPDIIKVSQNGGQVLTQDDCNLIKPFTSIHSPREVGNPKEVATELYGFSVSIEQKDDTITGKTDLYINSSDIANELLSVKYKGTTPLSSGNELPYADLTIQDSMAPVINHAVYLDLQGATAADTLKIIFSEKTGEISGINPFNILKVNNTTPFSPDLKYVRTANDTVLFICTPAEGSPSIGKNDSIWINSEGGVSDLNGIYQTNSDNVKRKVNYYKIANIISASYKDNSTISDGLIDEISIKTDSPVDSLTISYILDSISLPSERQLTINGYTINDSGFVLKVTQPESIKPRTSTDSLDKLTILEFYSHKNSAIFKTSIIIADSLPPIINEAYFSPAFKTDISQNIPDTLQIVFSENVTSPPYSTDQPFKFYCGSGDSSYSMTLNFIGGDKNSFRFAVIEKTKQYPQAQDSVNIDILASISDLKMIYQNNEDNRYAPISTGSSDLLLKILITKNPGMHTDTYIANGKTINGIGIKVNILGSGWPSGMEMAGNLKILDAVGNIVNEIEGTPISDHSGFWFHWNGRNTNNRLVHSASYLGLIKIVNLSENISSEEKIMIGVKEKLE